MTMKKETYRKTVLDLIELAEDDDLELFFKTICVQLISAGQHGGAVRLLASDEPEAFEELAMTMDSVPA